MKTRNLFQIQTLLLCIICFSSCEKEDQYASATINGVEYEEIKTSGGLQLHMEPHASIIVWENYSIAGYYTTLKPLKSGHPTFIIHVILSLESNNDLEINKSYKIAEIKLSEELSSLNVATLLEKTLPDGYDGVAICKEEGVSELFSLEGEFKLERYDTKTEFYYGSYILTHPSRTLLIKGNFKVVESRNQITFISMTQ